MSRYLPVIIPGPATQREAHWRASFCPMCGQVPAPRFVGGQALWYVPPTRQAAYRCVVSRGPNFAGVPGTYQYQVTGRYVPRFSVRVEEAELFATRAEAEAVIAGRRHALAPEGPRLNRYARGVLAEWERLTVHRPDEFYQTRHVFTGGREDQGRRRLMHDLARHGWVVVRDDGLASPFILGGNPLRWLPWINKIQ